MDSHFQKKNTYIRFSQNFEKQWTHVLSFLNLTDLLLNQFHQKVQYSEFVRLTVADLLLHHFPLG